MLQPLSPHRCAILRGLFTWSFSTCGEGDTMPVPSGWHYNPSVHTELLFIKMCTQLPHSSLPRSEVEKGEVCISAVCLQDIRALLLNTDDNSNVLCGLCPPTSIHQPRPKQPAARQENNRLRWSQTRGIPSVNLGVSKLHLIGCRTEAYISLSRFNQNNTSEDINLYSRGDQM